MSYFLSKQPLEAHTEVTIDGEEARHILLSRRIKIGETLNVQDPRGKRFSAVVANASKHALAVSITEEIAVPPEPATKIILVQALVAEQALDTILQKATELGAAEVVLFPAERSPLSHERAAQKLERWTKILIEAAKQSDRAVIPKLSIVSTFTEVLKKVIHNDLIIALHPHNNAPLSLDTTAHKGIALIVGPEGGLSEAEVGILSSIPNINTHTLGPRILRSDTVAIAGLALLAYHYSDLK